MGTTVPSLDPVTDILDTDKIMVTQQSGQSYTISGANFNKRNQAVIANRTTLTGAPLKTGNIVRAYFTADITGVNTTTGLVLNYNGSNKNVKVPKNGALVNFTAQNMGGTPTVYKYLQAYTMLELLYDGTNFVIIGNPVVISSADYTIYADGTTKYNKTFIDNNTIPLLGRTLEGKTTFDTGIYANKGTPNVDNTKKNLVLRQKAFLVCLNLVFSTGDNTGYILGMVRLGRDGGNVSFTEIKAEGQGLSLLRNVTFTAGTGTDDTLLITNNNNSQIMVNIIL